MKKTKITPPMSIQDFAADIANFAKNDASKTEISNIKSEVKDMIDMLETWKAKNKTTQKM